MSNDPSPVFHLEVALEANELIMSAREYVRGEEGTIRSYDQIPVSMDRIEQRCQSMVETLNRANRNGRLTSGLLTKLKENGQFFFDEFFPLSIKEKLRGSVSEHLIVDLTDRLVHVPWELVYNGEVFLCNRFSIGRMVKTRQAILGGGQRKLSRPLQALVLVDPEGDLRGAYGEGSKIREYMDTNQDLVNATLRSGNISSDYVRKKMRNFDIIHFAGHAVYDAEAPENGGWQLSGDVFRAVEVMKMAGSSSNSMPALIFSNACESARTEQWSVSGTFQNEIFGLANAFLLAGVKHFVGTFWEILDEPSSHFALTFYKSLLAGKTTGESLRTARQATVEAFGEETVVWASYVLYGDPTSRYVKSESDKPEAIESQADPVVIGPADSRTRREVVHFGENEKKGYHSSWVVIAIIILIMSGIGYWGVRVFSQKQVTANEKEAVASYQQGRFQEALELCDLLKERDSENGLAYLLEGHILLRRGQLDEAKSAYERAVALSTDKISQKAEALSGLGRVASLKKQVDLAIEYYRDASETFPEGKNGYVSQALLLESQGRYQDAMKLVKDVQRIGGEDGVLSSFVNELSRKVALSSKLERQKRRDELLKTLSSPAQQAGAAPDHWTSFPLTVMIKEFETTGYSIDEGQSQLLASAISNVLLKRSRVRVVERALFDDLLEEFALGESDIVDADSALSVGKVLAARLLLTGHVSYLESATKVAVRLIESETSRIMASTNDAFGVMTPVSLMAEKIAGELLEAIQAHYPLRARVLDMVDGSAKLDIGYHVGVQKGDRFVTSEGEAIMEVFSVSDDSSQATVLEGRTGVEKGDRVEIMRH